MSGTVNPCDAADESRAAGIRQPNVVLSHPLALQGLACQEASIHSRETYIPCGAPSTSVVWHSRDKRAYLMCSACAWHNVRNRGGRLLMTTDSVVLR